MSMTRNVHTHSAAGNRSLQHQDTSHRRSADLVIHDAVDSQFSVVASKYLLPGWPIRLMQAVSIGSGLVLLLRGLNGLSLQYLDVENLLAVGAGAYLIFLPRLRRFDDIVANLKVRMFTKEDWARNTEHLPTRQDLAELVIALVQGNKTKQFGLLIGLFFLTGFFTLFAVVFYVVGLRRAFDQVEGWLLDRSAND